MAAKAKHTFWKWWRSVFRLRKISVAGLAALTTVISALVVGLFYLFSGRSDTSLMVTDLDADAISCYLWNTGRQPSHVVRGVLTFGPFAFENAELQVADPKTSVIPTTGTGSGSGVALELRLGRIKQLCTTPPKRDTALYVDIVESNGTHNIQRVLFSKTAIQHLIDSKRGDVDPCE